MTNDLKLFGFLSKDDANRRLHNVENSLLVLKSFFEVHPQLNSKTLENAIATIEQEFSCIRTFINPGTKKPSEANFEILRISNTLVLIEDNTAIADFWKSKAIQSNKTVICFNSPKEFLEAYKTIDQNIPIVIDQYFHSDISGIELSKILNIDGFKYIFLSTSDKNLNLEDAPWILGILDKLPTW